MSEELQQWLGSGAGVTRRLGRVSKHGYPLLYFPTSRALALQSLDLYPAQRTAARCARAIMKALCHTGFVRALPGTSFRFPTDSPTTQFLCSVAGNAWSTPELAILAGNPQAEGRRYILLLYDERGQPAAVVKVGLIGLAARLIDQEAVVLQSLAGKINVAPRLLASHTTTAGHAIAIEFIHGAPPKRATTEELARVLTPWIDNNRMVILDSIPAWQRLIGTCGENPVMRSAQQRLLSGSFHPVVYHGDFTPWNAKRQPDGSWRVLDWERGELSGMPCWDWFHYHTQVNLLVDRARLVDHLLSLERLWNDPAFERYTRTAKVHSIIRELFLTYLLYSMHVIGPKESLPAKQALLDNLADKWKSV